MQATMKKVFNRETIQRYGAIVIFLALYLVNAIATPGFFTLRIFWNLVIQATPAILVGLGMTLVIATGNINISVGSMMGLGGVVFAYFVKRGMNPLIIIIGLFAIGIVGYAIGLFA